MPRSDALDYLLGIPQFANVADDARKPGLERMHALMDAMDDPHEALHAIHVAGTNGKGSVSSMIAAIATAAGLRTGLHTSPHLTHVTQRMCIDGTPAPTDWLADTIDDFRPVFDRLEPSFFEMTVALTFRYFAEQDVDLAVVEVGLGGRLDSTNVLHPALAVITNIDLDHTDLLGDSLGEIAREKAGIIKAQAPALSGVTQDEARAAIAEAANDQGVPLHELRDEVAWRAPHADLAGSTLDVETPLRRYDRLRVSLPGTHQQGNAVLALRAAELVVPAVQANPAPVHEGLRDVRRYTGFRGRLEVLQEQPLVVLDVAHNPSGIAASLQTVGPAVDRRGGTLYVCLNAVRGKGLPDVADRLAEHGAQVIPIPIDTKRALPPAEIADTLRARGVAVREPRSLRQALIDYQHFAQAGDGLLLTGSHKMVEVLPDDLPFLQP
jgi:dihydrofolate synthase/folylpolyglutamate synthase